jgi:hypothetical protein
MMTHALLAVCLGATALYSNFDGTAIHKTGPQTMAGPLTITGDPSLDVRGRVSNGGASYGGSVALADPVRWLSTLEALLESSTTPTGGTDTGTAINSLSALGATDKLLSVRNATVEKCYLDGAGGIWSSSGTLKSGVGATAGVDTAVAVSTDATFAATDKILSVANSTSEVWYVMGAGGMYSGSGNYYSGVAPTAGVDTAYNLKTQAGLVAADKILSLNVDTSEVCYVDGTGGIWTGSGKLTSGVAATGGLDTGLVLNTAVTYAASDYLLNVNNNGNTKWYLYGNGQTSQSGSAYAPGFYANSTNSAVLNGAQADGATAIGVKFQNANALSTAGAKIASFFSDAGSTEKCYVDATGGIYSYSGAMLSGVAPSGSTDYAWVFDTQSGFSTTADSIAQFKMGGVGKAYIGADGGGHFSPGVWTSLVKPESSSAVALQVEGRIANGASAISVKVGSINALSTDGAKIAVYYNDHFSTEKAYVSNEGGIRPGVTVDAAPAQKYACTTTHEGEMIYSRDSDIGAGTYGGMCVCACDGDGTPTCGWKKINGGANCY